MINKTNFFITSLVAILVAGPAFSDEPATQDWVKGWMPGWAEHVGPNYFISADKESDFFPKRRGEVLSSGTAHQMRDLLYRHKSDTAFDPDSSMIKEGYGLRTTSQTAFEGINEVLEKVDGNNGTSGSATTLNTTAQNAFGAINELKVAVDGKVSSADLSSAVSDAIGSQIGNDLNTIYDTATETRKSVAIVDTFTAQDLQNIQSITE